jgi:glycosyltransferase involved in cell wall biosynthesis
MQDPKFSFIIPCYNGKDYLLDCFNSIADQTFKDFEVIFIDDNSNDGSFSYAVSLQKDLKLKGDFFQKPSQIQTGVSSSRNLACHKSSGQWLVFLDCDDYLHPTKLERINSFIQENPQAHAIHHAYQKFGDTIPKSTITIDNGQKHDFNFLILENPIGTSTVAIKKEVFEDLGGFNTNLNGVEDYFLWCRIANKIGPWDYLSIPLTYYRYLPNSLMSQRKFSYYINQMCEFYQEASNSKEFDVRQLEMIHKNLFYDQLNYRVKISLEFYGISDFLNGLGLLVKRGETMAAFHHLRIQFKNFALFQASKVFNNNPNSR